MNSETKNIGINRQTTKPEKMSNSLSEIDRRDLTKLLHLYKSNGAKSYIGYLTLSNYIGFFTQDPDIKHVKVYCLNGDFSDGTFIVTVSILHSKFASQTHWI